MLTGFCFFCCPSPSTLSAWNSPQGSSLAEKAKRVQMLPEKCRASPAPQGGSQYRLTKGKRQDSRTAVTASLHASHDSRTPIHPRCRCTLSRLVGRTGKMACQSSLVCTLGKSGKPFFGVPTSRVEGTRKGALRSHYVTRAVPTEQNRKRAHPEKQVSPPDFFRPSEAMLHGDAAERLSTEPCPARTPAELGARLLARPVLRR